MKSWIVSLAFVGKKIFEYGKGENITLLDLKIF